MSNTAAPEDRMPDDEKNLPQPSQEPAQETQAAGSPVTPAVTQAAPPPAPPKPGQPVRKAAVRTKPVRPSGQITTEAGHTPLTEEFDRARWTLPPASMFFIALGIVAVVVAAIAFLGRAKPVASGSINDVGVVQVSDNSVLAVVQFTMYNTTEKPLWIKEMAAKVKTDQGEFSDTAASASDFERYFQGFPDLRLHAGTPMLVETKIAPGARQSGTILVSFPINKDGFDKRQSLSVIVTPYDQRDVVLTKTGATP
jgi:hypothetical protein